MVNTVQQQNENNASQAFSKQSIEFDQLYANDGIIAYKRKRVRDHVLSYLKSSSNILELNAGTGEDAIFFAGLGHTVHATDISEGMQQKLREKTIKAGFINSISTERCSFTELNQLQKKGPYDLIFSNFAGLNCSNELGNILDSFNGLLKPGGMVCIVVLSKFCLWEFLLLFRGKLKTATRRLFSSGGKKAHINGIYFTCWYYSPRFVKKHLKQHYNVEKQEGLCCIVPPSYIEHFTEKHPRLFAFLRNWEERLKGYLPWKNIGDYFIISLKKKEENSPE